ncbi:MAG: hypothetical protein RL685_5671 [Pseudomonadota bacterium]|jgi:hypothetical protein
MIAGLLVTLPARAFVRDTRAEERRCPDLADPDRVARDVAAPDVVDPGCPSGTVSAALLGDELVVLPGPGFGLVRGAQAVAEAGCAAEAIARAALTDAVQRAQQRLGVDAELAVVLSAAAPTCNSIFYVPLANDVRGIGYGHEDGRERFDDTPDSALEGVAFLNDWPYWRTRLEELHGSFHHELGHRWGARVLADIPGGAEHELLGRGREHWSYFLDTRGSPHEGNVWLGDESGWHSQTPLHGSQFSSLDLYLMGVATPAEVEPFELLLQPSTSALDCRGRPVTSASPPQSCQSIDLQAQRAQLTIDSILAREGPREPAASTAPRSVSVLALVLDSAQFPLGPSDCRELGSVLGQRFTEFEQATRGRLRLSPVLSAAADCDAAEWSVAPAPVRAAPAAARGGCAVSLGALGLRAAPAPGPAALRWALWSLPLLGLCRRAIGAFKARGAGLRSRHDQAR